MPESRQDIEILNLRNPFFLKRWIIGLPVDGNVTGKVFIQVS